MEKKKHVPTGVKWTMLMLLLMATSCQIDGKSMQTPSRFEYPNTAIGWVRAIKEASPVKMAQNTYAEGMAKFLAIRHYSISTPGVDRIKNDAVITRMGIKIIEGTSDIPTHKKTPYLWRHAGAFCRKHNQELLRLTGSRDSLPPAVLRAR